MPLGSGPISSMPPSSAPLLSRFPVCSEILEGVLATSRVEVLLHLWTKEVREVQIDIRWVIFISLN